MKNSLGKIEYPESEGKEKLRAEFEKINEAKGLKKEKDHFVYKGYEVTIVKDENDPTPAWFDIDARTGKWIILILDSVPNYFYIPLLEHEVYELEQKDIAEAHKKAVEIGREKAKELSILDEFLAFEAHWQKRKERKETEKKIGDSGAD